MAKKKAKVKGFIFSVKIKTDTGPKDIELFAKDETALKKLLNEKYKWTPLIEINSATEARQ